MTTWKVLAALAVLALPVAFVVADVGSGADEPAPRPALVLPEQPTADASPGPGKAVPEPDPRPSPDRTADRCDDAPSDDAADSATDDASDGDDDDDDRVEIVRPCPDDIGDDDDDDDRGERED